MNFSDLDLLKVGNSIRLAGVIYADAERGYICMLPNEELIPVSEVLLMNAEEWKLFLRQTDLLETYILEQSSDGSLAKALIRKSQRQIDQVMSWRVFKRDNYTCRYCGADGVPLTVDHIVLWEEGGPTTDDNLNTACRKCNHTRGSEPYEEWIKSRYYRKVSQRLSAEILHKNEEIVGRMQAIPRTYTKRSR